ncbi:MAG TPA: phosphate ABC transporter substrate-binding protein PstS [Gemmatimonadaceae bacterium]|nr:phosphate ABC transporter substrate-binding protein PstS [Gemmatimonadaceae bacterium]HPV75260.1 phosphate ABC transporter substrate-binding protein PstS [Gemmatimonadaceae bacterium]HQW67730.1 phosphate ABC transporter substrate-binding protein PstS [Gemmatimonadales bacterium]
MYARALSALAIVTIAACGGGETKSSDSAAAPAQSSSSVDLNGAGATFPYPIYSKWFSDYATTKGIKINYQSIGSGGGIKQLSEQTVDFGATDGPMSEEEMANAKGGKVLHFPTVLGADVVTYNLPEVKEALRLTGELVADIFLGKVTKWNDPRIAAENAGVALPAKDILVVHRSDGSGTTYIFTDYLTTVSKAWAAGPGKGKSVQWPVGLGGKGNEGVAGAVKQTPGTIGYVELAYANQNKLPTAHIKNAMGEYVQPTIASITAAGEGASAALGADSDYRVSIVNAPGAGAYPISSFTWLLVYEKQADAAKGQKLVDFMKWMYADGQQSASALDYAPLPAALATQLAARLSSIQIGSTP